MRDRLAGQRLIACLSIIAVISGCANRTLANKPTSYYRPPVDGLTSTIVGEQKSGGLLGSDSGVFVQSVFSDQLTQPLETLSVPLQIPAGDVAIGIGYADWKHVAGTLAFFRAEPGREYQIRLGKDNARENSLNKVLGYGQDYVWIEDMKTKKPVSEQITIHPAVPDRNTPVFMLLLPKKQP